MRPATADGLAAKSSALLVLLGDDRASISIESGARTSRDGRVWIFFNLDDLDRLRAAEPLMSMVLDEDGQSLRPVPNPAGEARRREIVKTYDRWLAERAEADRRHGRRARSAAWREREAATPSKLAWRLTAVRRLPTELKRQVAGLEAEVHPAQPLGADDG